MAKEESHADAVETAVTGVSACKGSASSEKTRNSTSPPANSDSNSSSTCPAQQSKRTTAEEEQEELGEEEYGTVSAATTLHKGDFVDHSSRHLQHGNLASLQRSLRIGNYRKAAGPRELFPQELPADAPFAGSNGRAGGGEEDAEGTGSASRGTSAAFRKAIAGGEEKQGRGGADGVDNLRSGQPAAAAELVMAGRRQDVVGASAAPTKPADGTPKAFGRTGGRPPAAVDALNMKMKEEGAQADHGEGATTTTTMQRQQQQRLLEAEQLHQQQLQEQQFHGQKMDEQQEASQQDDDDGCGAEEPQPVVCPRYLLEALPVVPPAATLSDYDIQQLHEARHSDPFGVLGPHEVVIREPPYENKKVIVVRAWVRNAERIRLQAMPGRSECVLPGASAVVMKKRAEFLFEKAFIVHHLASHDPASSNSSSQQQEKMQQPQEEKTERDYGPAVASGDPGVKFQYQLLCLYSGDPSKEERQTYDTYSFGMLLPTFDLELFQSGSCWHVDNLLGSHCVSVGGVPGVRFAVWAPAARRVAVVGDWNGWDGRVHPMRKRLEFGVWELFIPLLQPGEKYNYQITARDNQRNFFKIDPYAQEFEVPPKTASIISACDDAFKKPEDRFQWTDGEWMTRRKRLGQKELRRQPMAIYEVHLPSWMRGDNNTYLSYRELADRLVGHVKNMNFTHVEFLPLAHHPFEGSWGYQVTGQYAPYSRLGSPDDFKYLVNTLHRSNIGVFLDFVPAHFCKDAWGLAQYDGEACYEYADPREGEHKLWGTLVFNFRRNEVRSFLLGAAYHWLRRYHIDGLRIDAVSSMLYKNHQRPAGEWIANEYGGDANLQAMSLLQELNWVIHKQFPGVFTMAEESTSWQGVTDQEKGLGFDAKWDLGWMNDTLSYLCLPLYKRPEPACHNKLTFRGLYMGHEKWVLPLSHDEVVSGKGSLLDKCGFQGSPFEDRVKTLKTLFGFQVGSPGRPLIFMGAEIGQGREWSHQRSVDWHEGQEELRKKLCLWLSDLLAVYAYHPALHAGDDEPWNFKWTDCDNHNDCVIAFLRSYQEWYNDILVVCNFSPNPYYRYPVGVPHGGAWQVVLNSDDWRYAGGMVGPGNLTYVHTTQGGRLGWPYCLWLDLPPFGCLYLKCPQPSQEKKPMLADQQLQREEEKVELRQGEQQQQQQAQEEEEEKQQQQPSQKQQQDNAKGACTGSDSAACGCVSERQQLVGSAAGFAAAARDSSGVPNGTPAATRPAEQRQQQQGGKHSSK